MRHGKARALLAATLAGALAVPAGALGGPLPTGSTARASVGTNGQQARGPIQLAFADHPALSANGRFVTFTSNAAGLAGDCGRAERDLLGYNVYARDLATGVTELVSVEPGGCPTREGADQPVTSSVSDDGRMVAFTSGGNMVKAMVLRGQAHMAVYVRDRLRKRTVAVSVGYDGRANNADAQFPAISGNGRYVVFESGASNLVRNDPHGRGDNLLQDLYVRDLVTGRTERVGSAHPRAHGIEKVNASVSYDGRWITYETTDVALFSTRDYGPGLPTGGQVFPPGLGPRQVFLYDRLTKRNRMVSHSPEGYGGNSDSDLGRFQLAGNHTVSADGRYVVFASDANNLLPGDPLASSRMTAYSDSDPADDVYLYDRVTDRLTRVTTGPGGVPGDGISMNPAISPDGRYVAFESGATNLGPVDLTAPLTESSGFDVFVYDRVAGTHALVSASTDGLQATLNAGEAAISGNGRVVAFTSAAPNLVPDDTNGLPDVFVHRTP